jgi:methylenetetrahydrofolate dehydrogenase (NADP+)/methenyltetrahydrofolate cyclohydrolase
MRASIIDGKGLAEQRIEAVRIRIEEMKQQGHRAPGLAVVLVGSDPASQVYVRNKSRSCDKAGIQSSVHNRPEDTSQEQLLALVDELNATPDVDGVLVQLPLPDHLDQTVVTNSILPEKDVDGAHAENMGRLALGQSGLRPCTPKGVMTMLKTSGVDPKGQHCVIVGRSSLVGRPMVLEMLIASATVTCCHSLTRDLEQQVRNADILVAAVGRPGIIDGNWVREDAVVIDVGINRKEDGSLCGDVEFDAAASRARLITPVPGGVGPMTVATLLENTLEAAESRLGLK